MRVRVVLQVLIALPLLTIVALTNCNGDELVNVDISNGLVTTNVDSFIAGLRQVNGDNEVLIAVRGSGEPPVDLLSLRQIIDPGEVALVSVASDTAAIRRAAGQGLAAFSAEDRDAVAGLLGMFGAQKIRVGSSTPVVVAVLPSDLGDLRRLLAALAVHPNFDFAEANRGTAATPDG